MALGGKWIQGGSADHLVSEFARRVLEGRLSAVWHWLPLAAHRGDEDIEYVHELRVSARRAAAALRMFRSLLPDAIYKRARERLGEIRRSADGARNWDVFTHYLLGPERCDSQGTCEQVLAGVHARRADSQRQIVSVHRSAVEDSFERQAAEIVAQVRFVPKRPDQPEPTLRRRASKCLKPVVKRFWRAAAGDLSDARVLHALRICGKKLRYSIEILAPAFGRAFRGKLYCRLQELQDRLGRINDHVTALKNLRQWLGVSMDPQETQCLQDLIATEEGSLADSRAKFSEWWTPRRMARLKQRFKKYV